MSEVLMTATFSPYTNQLNNIEFSKFPEFPLRIKKFQGIPAGYIWDAGFPGHPGNSRMGMVGAGVGQRNRVTS